MKNKKNPSENDLNVIFFVLFVSCWLFSPIGVARAVGFSVTRYLSKHRKEFARSLSQLSLDLRNIVWFE